MRWITNKALTTLVQLIKKQYALYTELKLNGQQVYEHGLYGRLRYWLHGTFSHIEKTERRMFRKQSKRRWGK
jgi:hypothetical protein